MLWQSKRIIYSSIWNSVNISPRYTPKYLAEYAKPCVIWLTCLHLRLTIICVLVSIAPATALTFLLLSAHLGTSILPAPPRCGMTLPQLLQPCPFPTVSCSNITYSMCSVLSTLLKLQSLSIFLLHFPTWFTDTQFTAQLLHYKQTLIRGKGVSIPA